MSTSMFGRSPEVLATATAACQDKDCVYSEMMQDYQAVKRAIPVVAATAAFVGFLGCFVVLFAATRVAK